MFNPKVSIIIPVYNGSNYLSAAIESALNQTYDNIEIIVINDGSSDNGETEKVAQFFGDKIRYIYKKNGGVSTALNLGIEKMTGEYFSWLSHDDLYYPNKIEEQIKLLEKLDDKNIILSTDISIINEIGKTLKFHVKLNYKPEKLLYTMLVKGIINGCTLLISKKCFYSEGKFNPELKTTQDYDMWFRLIKKYSFKNIDIPLVKSRVHKKQDSIRLKKLCKKEQKELLEKVFTYFTIKEIKSSSGSSLPISLLKFKIILLRNTKDNFLVTIINFLKIIKLYSPIQKIWNKLKKNH